MESISGYYKHWETVSAYRLRRDVLENWSRTEAALHGSHTSGTRRVPEGMLVLNMFNYKDLQRLSILAERLEEAALVVQLNIGTLRDVYEHYQGPIPCGDVAPAIKIRMEKATSRFSLRLQQMIRSLETRHTQLVSLRERLHNGKALYENLLQLRSLQVSRIFAEHGHRSSINMEDIARRTERETVSMHTVTVVTLLFLPATFLGTFFQSGVFQWAETPEIVGDWFFRTDVFRLFMAICVPMTALTLVGWLVVNTSSKMKPRRKASEDDMAAEAMTRSRGLPV
ncbi:hypothetical protein C8A00DRAFT_37121 [Chaetomidium leptoderma]|uniref:Uncharacterized protein n=1 Tax=Chaetomidium leptoderma TaxID=669021 RepID=A0AAN6VF16_9PEZI|nr:hypothetical protein C8A00DRAFT_37121 [Chaetomidium leptoderma]